MCICTPRAQILQLQTASKAYLLHSSLHARIAWLWTLTMGNFVSDMATEGSPRPADSELYRPPDLHNMRTCVACLDDKEHYQLVTTPCGHHFCSHCFLGLVQSSLDDPMLSLARCCGHTVPVSLVERFLSSRTADAYQDKFAKLHESNKLYCHVPTCSSLIPATNALFDTVLCPRCGNVTCKLCKGPEHQGECPQDVALQQVLDTAKDQGWQRCPKCHQIIELGAGCNHIICTCGAQFCYSCGAKWRTCSCSWFPPNALFPPEDVDDQEFGDDEELAFYIAAREAGMDADDLEFADDEELAIHMAAREAETQAEIEQTIRQAEDQEGDRWPYRPLRIGGRYRQEGEQRVRLAEESDSETGSADAMEQDAWSYNEREPGGPSRQEGVQEGHLTDRQARETASAAFEVEYQAFPITRSDQFNGYREHEQGSSTTDGADKGGLPLGPDAAEGARTWPTVGGKQFTGYREREQETSTTTGETNTKGILPRQLAAGAASTSRVPPKEKTRLVKDWLHALE